MTATKPLVYTGTGSAIDNYKSEQPQSNENWGLFKKTNIQHMQILSLMRSAKWTVKHEKYGDVADLERLSDFLKSDKSPVKKPLLEMDKAELSKIIIAIGGVVAHKYK